MLGTYLRPEYTITTQPIQFSSGDATGLLRHNASVNLCEARGIAEGQSLETHQFGAQGEVAFSVAYNFPYVHTVNQFGKPDFVSPRNGAEIDVKRIHRQGNFTVSLGHYHPEWLYFFVFGQGLRFEMCGYIKGVDLQDEWIGNPGNRIDRRTGEPALAYVVPARNLTLVKPLNFGN